MMKYILFLFCLLFVVPSWAQDPQKAGNKLDASELFLIAQERLSTDTTMGAPNTHGQEPAVPWSRVQYGFINFADCPKAWKDLKLDWSHSFSLQINLWEFHAWICHLGLGMEYQRLMFYNPSISITQKEGDLKIINVTQEALLGQNVNIKRSVLKNLYLTIPLYWQIPLASKTYFIAGFSGGIRLHTKTKMVYKNDRGDTHRAKEKGDFHVPPCKVDLMARLGYKDVYMYFSYALTDLFKSSDLHLYQIGLGIRI